MKGIFKAALFATTVLAPAAALAASPGTQGNAAGPAANPCDQLLQAFDRQDASRLTITRQQAQTFKNNNDLNSCRTALNAIQTPAAQGSAATATASGTTPGTAAGTAAGAATAAAGAPQVTIQQPAPQVIIQQTQPTVSVSQGQPEIIVHQPAPIVTVQIPPPEITVRMPKPEVNVAQAQPQVSVQQERPNVQVVPAPGAQTAAIVETPRPIVRFSSDQPQVTVNRAEQPNIKFEDLGTPSQQQAALGQTPSATGQAAVTGAGNQIMVSELQGKTLMGPMPNDQFGTITAVIMDTQNKPFVIVEKGGQHYAVDVQNVQMRGQNLLIVGVTDTSRFPAWNDSDPANRNVKRLTPQERVTIRTSG
jgi:hypothetical protein